MYFINLVVLIWTENMGYQLIFFWKFDRRNKPHFNFCVLNFFNDLSDLRNYILCISLLSQRGIFLNVCPFEYMERGNIAPPPKPVNRACWVTWSMRNSCLIESICYDSGRFLPGVPPSISLAQ